MEMDRLTGNVLTNTTTGFMIWKNSDWSFNLLNSLWDNPGHYRFGYFHEQTRLDEFLQDFFLLPGGENVLNRLVEDIDVPIILNNIKIIPYSYHRCFEDGVINYVYHAGGNTLTKLERIKKMLI